MKLTPLHLFYFSAFLKSQMFLLPVLYLFYLENGLTTADYFLFQGIIVLINVFLQIPAGFIGDKISRKYIVLISYTLFLGRIFLWFFLKGPWVVFAGEILYAVSKALFDTVESPYLYDMLKEKGKTHKMVKGYSKLNFALSLGTAIAALTGAWLYDTVGLKILLGTEFIFITASILMAFKLPYIQPEESQDKISVGQKFLSAFKNCITILKQTDNRYFIFYSGLLVSFSHFFFWSFQPIMKTALVPIGLFGVVMFINNMMRSFCSLLTDKLMRYISLIQLGKIAFVLNVIGLFGCFVFQKVVLTHWIVCLVFILYLCVCIVLQLMFTIAHISRLQQIATSKIRTQIAATNMMIARLFTAICLIIPKYLTEMFPLMTLYAIYGFLFFAIGFYLIQKLKSQEQLSLQ